MSLLRQNHQYLTIVKEEEVRETLLEPLDISCHLRQKQSQVYLAALMTCISTNWYILWLKLFYDLGSDLCIMPCKVIGNKSHWATPWISHFRWKKFSSANLLSQVSLWQVLVGLVRSSAQCLAGLKSRWGLVILCKAWGSPPSAPVSGRIWGMKYKRSYFLASWWLGTTFSFSRLPSDPCHVAPSIDSSQCDNSRPVGESF